jgi:hypothetical protein
MLAKAAAPQQARDAMKNCLASLTPQFNDPKLSHAAGDFRQPETRSETGRRNRRWLQCC